MDVDLNELVKWLDYYERPRIWLNPADRAKIDHFIYCNFMSVAADRWVIRTSALVPVGQALVVK